MFRGLFSRGYKSKHSKKSAPKHRATSRGRTAAKYGRGSFAPKHASPRSRFAGTRTIFGPAVKPYVSIWRF